MSYHSLKYVEPRTRKHTHTQSIQHLLQSYTAVYKFMGGDMTVFAVSTLLWTMCWICDENISMLTKLKCYTVNLVWGCVHSIWMNRVGIVWNFKGQIEGHRKATVHMGLQQGVRFTVHMGPQQEVRLTVQLSTHWSTLLKLMDHSVCCLSTHPHTHFRCSHPYAVR